MNAGIAAFAVVGSRPDDDFAVCKFPAVIEKRIAFIVKAGSVFWLFFVEFNSPFAVADLSISLVEIIAFFFARSFVEFAV